MQWKLKSCIKSLRYQAKFHHTKVNYFFINDNPYNFEFFMTGHSDTKFQIAGLKWQMEFTFKKFGLYLRFTFGQIKHKWVRSAN